MYRLKEPPVTRAINYVSCMPATFLAVLEDRPDTLVVRSAVFHVVDGEAHLLLLKRSETDSLPGRWELPGGTMTPSLQSLWTLC